MYASVPASSQPREPRWRPAAQLLASELPSATRTWLLDEDSLTARLLAASGGRLRVNVLAQQWRRPLPNERAALALQAHEIALVREVLLECAGVPWVYARSILPARALAGELRHLRRFGARSLGALLFADARIRRAPFELARIAPGSALLPRSLTLDRAVWARRSRFELHERALLVQELFLPACRLGSL